MDVDYEYELVCENDQLDFELRYLAADLAVLEREGSHLGLDAECWSMYQEIGQIIGRLDQSTPPTAYDLVERSCYALRCEHGEWPTGPELAERLAADAGTTYAMAEFMIDQAINDQTDDARLYLALRLLGDTPRLFVDASAVEDLDCHYMGRLALEAAA